MKMEKENQVLETGEFSFDPNLSSAARYSPTYPSDSCHNIILVPGDIVHENTLLRLEDASQTFILSSSSDPSLFVRTVHEIESHTLTTYGEQQMITNDFSGPHQINNYVTSDQQDGEETTQTTQIIYQKMVENPEAERILQDYQNILIGDEKNLTQQQLTSVHNANSHINYQQDQFTENNHYRRATNNSNDCLSSGIAVLVDAYDDRNNILIEKSNSQGTDRNDNSNELDEGNEIDIKSEYDRVDQKEQERLLLEDSMSPLLTAVTNVSSLERNSFDMDNKKIFRNFLDVVSAEYIDINELDLVKKEQIENAGNSSKESKEIEHSTSVRRSQRKYNAEGNTYLMVADKHVPCRAWASLPTNYLYISKISDDSEEYSVFSKKEIPIRTKFGPFDGDIKDVTVDDKNSFRENGNRILYLNANKKLDVSNEYTSNWMRFVRYANNYTEQNLLLYELNDRLYFITLRKITSKEELKVGYSQEYAMKYNLTYFESDDLGEFTNLDTEKPWPCYECQDQFVTSDELQTHLNVHDENDSKSKPICNNNGKSKRNNSQKSKNKTSFVCQICSNKFDNVTILKDHMAKKHFNQTLNNMKNNDAADNIGLINSDSLNQEEHNVPTHNTNKSNKENKNNYFRCNACKKTFPTKERYTKHCMMVHILDDNKTEKCSHCSKYFSKPSSLVEHVKTHIRSYRIFYCVLCKEAYRYVPEFKEHVKSHASNGVFTCPHCNKNFKEYFLIRKHIRSFHPDSKLECSECGKLFPTLNKLQFHKLRHSDHREFLCSQCGIQFKRKDKLIHHMRRFHTDNENDNTYGNSKENDECEQTYVGNNHIAPTKTKLVDVSEHIGLELENVENESKVNERTEITSEKKKFQPKVSPNDYRRFIYKCHDCLLGFKRRGMLVNHLAKRHPDIKIDSVPELNLPILKAERYYYCQYCEKVYKSSSKRKAHIIKNHPGAELPLSNRHKGGVPEVPGFPNPTYSETIGNITTNPQGCAWCHKQYASKAKLIQHQRKKHPEHLKEVQMSDHNILNVISEEQSHNIKFEKNITIDNNEFYKNDSEEHVDQSIPMSSSIISTKACKFYIDRNYYNLGEEKNFILIEEHNNHNQELRIEEQSNEEIISNIFNDIDFMQLRPVINNSNKLLMNDNTDFNYSHNTG